MEVELIGNIGVPVTDTYDRPLVDAYVVEVSSYQAADVTVSPGVCVLTSLAPDHLDWHGGEEPYYRDKLRLIEAGPPGRPGGQRGQPRGGAPHRRPPAAARCSGPPAGSGSTPAGVIEVDGEPVVDSGRLRAPGRHNLWNLCGAIAGAMLLERRAALAGARSGRRWTGSRACRRGCRTIGRRDGLTFVDDALASNPFATMASVEAFPGRELTVILGGADRGIDARPLAEALARRSPGPRRWSCFHPDRRSGWPTPWLRRPPTHRPAVPVSQAADIAGAVREAVALDGRPAGWSSSPRPRPPPTGRGASASGAASSPRRRACRTVGAWSRRRPRIDKDRRRGGNGGDGAERERRHDQITIIEETPEPSRPSPDAGRTRSSSTPTGSRTPSGGS